MTEDIVVPVRPIKADGDTTAELVFEGCERVTVHGSVYNDQLCFVLHGHRPDGERQIEHGILDILDDDVIANEVPRDDQGRSAPLAALLK
jgi:hypothetical protein